MNEPSDLIFAPEAEPGTSPTQAPWKLLIVDDEESVHEVTRLALHDFEFDHRRLQFLHAHSAAEARNILSDQRDIAVALVDVVMETEHAGLELIEYIRKQLKNRLIRLVIRTGQPGQAPERAIIRDFDINDYKSKTELTAQKLYTTIMASLRAYNDLSALAANRRGLESIIMATGSIFQIAELDRFIQGVMQQLVALLHLGCDSILLECDCVAAEHHQGTLQTIAGTGKFGSLVGQNPLPHLSQQAQTMIAEALQTRASVSRTGAYVAFFCPRPGHDEVIYVTTRGGLSADDTRLVELFLHNVAVAYENTLLRSEVEAAHHDMIEMLGEAIQPCRPESEQRTRRVAELSRLIALGMGLEKQEAALLCAASPLQNYGIPENIDLLAIQAETGSSATGQDVLKAASLLAGSIREKWDGSGYPLGLAGENIPLFGRIGAVADVFEVLAVTQRSRPGKQIIDYLLQQKGRQFDPAIIDWVIANMEAMLQLINDYPD